MSRAQERSTCPASESLGEPAGAQQERSLFAVDTVEILGEQSQVLTPPTREQSLPDGIGAPPPTVGSIGTAQATTGYPSPTSGTTTGWVGRCT